LPGLSEEKEAQLLGITKITSEVVDKLTSLDKFDLLSKMSPLEIYMLEYWSKNRKTPLSDIFEDYVKNQSYWKQRLGNYQHALLYTLVKNRTGIRKYYCGWDTFVKISGGNIRFLLQLVEESLMSHLRQAHSLDEPVSPDSQTISAQKVGRMNLTELEGLAVNGATLTKLLLGLGRVFGVMAATSEGHAPEVNQFKVASEGNAKERKDVDSLLTSSVMHLALVRWSGSKLSDVSETVEWDYMVHPIFAPFFNFSYRRKRKLSITGRQLLALVSDPHQAIKKILDSSNRVVGNDLPEQLQLFEMYYADKT
jgi:hypothetical protein